MARLDDRGGRDSAGFGPYHRPDAELTPLRELRDWHLGDGEPDIRGWEVRTVGGRSIGTVRDLLVDRAAREVVLLDIDVDGGTRRARAPIRAAQIDRRARVIRMDSADLLGDVDQDFRADVEPGDAVREREVVRDDRGVTPDDQAIGREDRAIGRDDREVDRAIAAHAADIRTRDRDLDAARNRDQSRDLSARETMRDERAERHADREADRSVAPEVPRDVKAAGVEETVVERRPVVVEEVVVRRRVVDGKEVSDTDRDARREP